MAKKSKGGSGVESAPASESTGTDKPKGKKSQKAPERISHKAITLKKTDTYRSFAMVFPVSELLVMCFAPRRSEDPASGYQRDRDPKHMQKLADFLKGDPEQDIPEGILGGALTLSVRPEAEFSFESKNGTASMLLIEGGCALLDGQHRVGAHELAGMEGEQLNCTVIVDLSLAQETRVFVDTNAKGKPVDRNHILEISKQAETEGEREGILRAIYDGIREDKILGPMLDPTGDTGLGRAGFYAAMRPLWGHRLKEAKSFATTEGKLERVRTYLTACQGELPPDKPIGKQSRLAGLMDAMPTVLEKALQFQKGTGITELRMVLRPIFAHPKFKEAKGQRIIAQAIVDLLPTSIE